MRKQPGFRRLSPWEAFVAMFWGDIRSKGNGGPLGSYRPAPFAFYFITLATIFIFGLIFLDGWMKVHSGVDYDDHSAATTSSSSSGGH